MNDRHPTGCPPEPPPPEPPEPPPPEPPEPPRFEETYRDVAIYWLPAVNLYWAQVAPGYVAVAPTLPEIRASIDEILEFLEPPPEPPDGLLAQVVAAVKVWFNENIGYRLQPVYDWIDEGLAGARLAWENLVADTQSWVSNLFADVGISLGALRDRWDTLTTETLPNIWDTITARVGEVGAALDQMKVDLMASLDEGLKGMGDYIDDRLLNYAPQGFQSDPEKYVKDHAEERFNLKVFEFVKSFWEGVSEGLAE